MVRTFIALILMLVLVPWGLGSFPSAGLAAEPFKMAVVDPQAVLEHSKAGQRALSMLKEYAAARQKILAEDGSELKALEAKLADQGKTLSDEEKRQLEDRFRAKLQSYQQRVREFNEELTLKQKELIEEYMTKIQAATQAVAEKEGIKLVVDKGSENTIKIVIYNKATLDITDKVIKEFDRQNK